MVEEKDDGLGFTSNFFKYIEEGNLLQLLNLMYFHNY